MRNSQTDSSLKLDSEYIKIAKTAAKKYADQLSELDLVECIYEGIHDALVTYDPKKSKLNTHIYNRVRFNCLNFLRNKELYELTANTTVELSEPVVNKFDPAFTEILIDRIVYKLPYKDIADKYSITIIEAKRMVRRRKRILKDLYKSQF